MEAATRAARANITLEDQIHQIHKVKGLIHDDEKEKIGPKPVQGSVTISHPPTSQAVSVQMSMASNMQNAMMQPHAPPNMMQSQPMMMVQQQQQMMGEFKANLNLKIKCNCYRSDCIMFY